MTTVDASGSKQLIGDFELLLPSRALDSDSAIRSTPFRQPLINDRSSLNQNQKLRAARDLLLPRLMSGEIAV